LCGVAFICLGDLVKGVLAKTKPKSNKNATATQEKKEMTAAVYVTTALDI
jgi:hypothetical protein